MRSLRSPRLQACGVVTTVAAVTDGRLALDRLQAWGVVTQGDAVTILTKEQAKSLADVLTAATR